MLRYAVVASVLDTILLLLVACAPAAPPAAPTSAPITAPTAAPTAVPTQAAKAAPGPRNGKQFVVGWTPLSDPMDEGRKAFDNGIRTPVESAGGKLLYCSPSPKGGMTGDPVLQANCVEQFIVQNADAIIIYAIDTAAIAPSIKKANEAKIPVFMFLGAEPKSLGIDVKLSLQNPNMEAAGAAAQGTIDFLKKKYGSAKGTVLEVGGLPTTSDAQERSKGFHDVIDKYPDIKVTTKPADWDASKGATIMQDWVTTHPDTDAMYFHSEALYAPAAKTALEPLGRWVKVGDTKKVFLSGIDGLNWGLHAVKCRYVDLIIDEGYHIGPSLLSQAIMSYLQTGVLPKAGDKIPITEPFGTGIVVEDPSFAGLILRVSPVMVTQSNADNPNLFGNKVQAPPNGMSQCE